jgi:hypothetical protein
MHEYLRGKMNWVNGGEFVRIKETCQRRIQKRELWVREINREMLRLGGRVLSSCRQISFGIAQFSRTISGSSNSRCETVGEWSVYKIKWTIVSRCGDFAAFDEIIRVKQ